ncbi:DUF6817 domain-containing protein [Amycolatopsis sp. CA-230715]|uniref:DUF6817 domain-containing protein n=1 Tax=Amycolatopsis sp. CA-230715 TaxID=2745196 RepID=UPI001C037AD5|nr:hypothetical protein [Amycolatopsis sp. CA-230715]QWF79432.1 hypothetical protein HUW46_02840 [Amycolatopsis sp. CA-230715]
MAQHRSAAEELLSRLGAEKIEHPGGTLLAHLKRVHDRLGRWDAPPAVRIAGLCHAAYGTDGFATALLPVERRGELADVIGAEAESLVYFYASCDRARSYRDLGAFTDRFTGRTFRPTPRQQRAFAELTAANELDLVAESPAFAEEYGERIGALLASFRPLLSEAAWRDRCALTTFSPLTAGQRARK